MKRLFIFIFIVLFFCNGQLIAQNIKISKVDGGSVITELGYGIKVNKNSLLHRTWIILNDSSCPIQLINSGINTKFSKREYSYKAMGEIKTSEIISAFSIRFILYDIFGRHIKTLSATEVTDIQANSSFQLEDIGSWRAWENEVSELLTIVSFVANVRTETGMIWRFNDKAITEELDKIQLQFTSGVLEPDKEKK
jgi:hypothetical protein